MGPAGAPRRHYCIFSHSINHHKSRSIKSLLIARPRPGQSRGRAWWWSKVARVPQSWYHTAIYCNEYIISTWLFTLYDTIPNKNKILTERFSGSLLTDQSFFYLVNRHWFQSRLQKVGTLCMPQLMNPELTLWKCPSSSPGPMSTPTPRLVLVVCNPTRPLSTQLQYHHNLGLR